MRNLVRALRCPLLALVALIGVLASCDSRLLIGGIPGAGGNAGGTSISATIQIPESRLRGRFQLQSASAEAIEALDFELEGPGIPKHKPVTDIDVQQTVITTEIKAVPPGIGRIVTAIAKKRKGSVSPDDVLQSIAGIVTVQANRKNPIYITLRTTPAAEVLKGLIGRDGQKAAEYTPEQLQELQDFIDRVIVYNPANGSSQHNPYFVDVDKIVDAIVGNDWQIVPPGQPSDYLMPPGLVQVIGAPAGAHLWLNDPVSPIVAVGGSGSVTIPDVVPNHGNAVWTLTVVHNGTVGRYPLRVTKGPTPVEINLTQPTYDASSRQDIVALRLDPAVLTFSRVEARQLAVFGLYGQAPHYNEVFIPQGVADLQWHSSDPAVATIGARSYDPLTGEEIQKLFAPGLVTPIGGGNATVTVTLPRTSGPAPSGTAAVSVNFGFPGMQVTLEHDQHLAIAPSSLTVNGLEPFTLTALEPNANATYTWRSSNTGRVVVIDGKANPATFRAIDNGTVTITCLSSTGRTTTATVTVTLNATAPAQTAITAPGPPAPLANDMTWVPWTAANTAGDAVTLTGTNPFGGSLAIGGYLKAMGAQALLQVEDPQFGPLLTWTNSNPEIVHVAGPARTDVVTVTALMPGQTDITARNARGQTIVVRIVAHFGSGSTQSPLQVPAQPNALVLSSPAGTLDAAGATATLQATDAGVPVACVWSSNSADITVAPVPGDASQAILTAKMPASNVTISAIDPSTGRRATRSVSAVFTASGTATLDSVVEQKVRITELSESPAAAGTTELVRRTIGDVITLRAIDRDDAGASFVWSSSNPSAATVLERIGPNQVRVRLLRPDTSVVLRADSSTGNAGTRSIRLTPADFTGNFQVKP